MSRVTPNCCHVHYQGEYTIKNTVFIAIHTTHVSGTAAKSCLVPRSEALSNKTCPQFAHWTKYRLCLHMEHRDWLSML